MALNKYMHPRNIYKSKKPDYKQLAIKYPEFRKHVFQDLAGNVFLDYKYPPSLRQLTLTLLKEDFGLDIDLPLDRLIPTIPLRLNYILWIEDILGTKGDNPVKGIDIGTGASCVYPLLGCKLNKWSFLATEVDEQNFIYAEKNVTANQMEDKIKVQKVTTECILYDVVKDKDETYDFCMCNPPFFSDHLESQAVSTSRSADRPDPRSVSTASDSESIVRGGEVMFVKKMIADSLKLKSKVRIYTTMLGKKTSLPDLKEELKQQKIPKYSTTEFCQGKTMRWGIAWTFDKTVNFPKSLFQQSKKEKPPLVYPIPEDIVGVTYDLQCITEKIKELLQELKIHCEELENTQLKVSLEIKAKENTWSHQRRKRRQKLRQTESDCGPQVDSVKTTSVNMTRETTLSQSTNASASTTNFDPCHQQQISRSCAVPENKSSVDFPSTSECLAHSLDKPSKNDTDLARMETNYAENCFNESVRKRKRSNDDGVDINVDVKFKCAKMTSPGGNLSHGGENICEKDTKITSCKETLPHGGEIVCEDGKNNSTHKPLPDGGENGCEKDVPHLITESIRTVHADTSGEITLNEVYESNDKEENYLLKCNVNVKIVANKINLEMTWIDGSQKDSMQQVMQYFKNKLKSAKMDNNNSKPSRSATS